MARRAFTLLIVAASMLAVIALPLGQRPGRLDAAQGIASPVASPLASPTASPAASPEAAQGASLDLGFQLPAGIAITPLGGGLAGTLPTAPAQLRLERVAIPAKTDLGMRQTVGPELLSVEHGALVFVDESGLEGTYNQGSQAPLPAGTSYGIRNDSAQPASLLRLTLSPTSAPASAGSGTPSASATTTNLLSAEVKTLPVAPARVVLARLAWVPGAELAEHTFTGSVGFVGESGTLTVVGSSGITAQLPPGKGAVFQSGVRNQERNDTNQPVVTLMVGVIAANQSPVVPVPTATPLATATPTATATPAPTATNTPQPTPTPQPKAGAVLYQADVTDGGFDKWSGSSDWKHVSGMLVNDGTKRSNQASVLQPILAPFTPGVADYAIEAETQVVSVADAVKGYMNEGFTCGVIARASQAGAYLVGAVVPAWKDPADPTFVGAWDLKRLRDDIGDGPYYGGPGGSLRDDAIAQEPFDPGTNWHTYRVEVKGNSIKLLIDGKQILEVIDNRYIDAGQVGLWSDVAQINVRSFKVIAL